MGRSDIFKLLLIILLLSNNDGCEDRCGGLSNINQIIIIMLLLNPPLPGPRTDEDSATTF